MGNICWLKVSCIKDIDIALMMIYNCKENNTKDTQQSADLQMQSEVKERIYQYIVPQVTFVG